MTGEKKPLYSFLAALIFAAAVLADQFTKRLALAHLGDHEPVDLIPGVLQFLRIENNGAAFGILQGKMYFFYIITAVVIAGIFFVIAKLPAERKYLPLLIVLSLIAAGAVGNLIDRVFRKSVIDFIYFKPIDFPVFNVADIFVTCSTAVLMFLILFVYKDEDLDFLRRKKHNDL